MEPNELSELTIRNKLKTLKNQDRIISIAASLVALKIELKNTNPETNRSAEQIHLEVVGKCSSVGWTILNTNSIVHLYPANYSYIGEAIQDEVTETVSIGEVILFMTKLVAAIELMNGA